MIMLISFFLGIVILISGDEIGSLVGYEYVSLICNVVGVCFMAYGVNGYLDGRREMLQCEKTVMDSLIDMSEKMVTASDVVTISEGLKTVCDNQIKIETALMNVGKNVDKFMQTYTAATFSLEEKKKLVDISQSVSDIVSLVGTESNKLCLMVEEQIKEVLTLNNRLISFNDENNRNFDVIHSEIVTMEKSVMDMDKRNAELLISQNEVVERASETECAQLEKVINTISGLNTLPQKLMENTDELSEKINNYILGVTNEIKYLMQDIEEQEKKRTKSFNNILQEISDSTAEHNEEVAEHIMNLGQQYVQFEKLVENLIRQITLMSESDYEVMKGFLNG